MKRILLAGLTMLVLLSGMVLADSPETGIVTGRVTDAAGSGLPGVMVTLEGERGAQTMQTDSAGEYRFAA